MKQREILTHIAIWTIALAFWFFWVDSRIEIFDLFIDHYKNIGYVVDTNDHQLGWYILISLYKAILLLILIYHLIPKFGFSRTLVFRTLIWFLSAITAEYVTIRFYFAWMKPEDSSYYRLDWSYDFYSILSIYFILILIGFIVYAAKNWVMEYRKLKELYQTQKSYETLKEQLNPHFLFNTVNIFYEIAVNEGNERLQNGILNLTKTLRYTIESSELDKVPLSQEIEAIQSFIELQKERMDQDEVDLVTSFQIEDPEIKITPLIVLNFVENAFIHGYRYGERSMIHINLTENQNSLQLSIENTNLARKINDQGGNDKTIKILKLNYPGRHKLEMNKVDNCYKTKLWIQLK